MMSAHHSAGSSSGPDRDEKDLLLSASLFQKSAAALFADLGNGNPNSAYFSSLWLEEFPNVNAASVKRVEQVYCPFCGTPRDAQNTRVRIKSRKRQNKSLIRAFNNISEKAAKKGETDETARVADERNIERFLKSKNKMILHCNTCNRNCTQPGLTREVQKNILSPTSRTPSVHSDVNAQPVLSSFLARIAASPALAGKIPSGKIVSYSAPSSPSPTASARKRRQKEANAGLILPPSFLSKSGLKSQAIKKISDDRNDGGNLLHKFFS